MMNRKKILFWMMIFFAGCSSDDKIGEKVFVSILPQKFFVEKIAKDFLEVEVMVQPGMSPATYDPLPKQMTDLSSAKIFFRTGAPFERSWIKRIEENYPGLKIIDVREGIELRQITNDPVAEISDKKNMHGHSGHDPHIWLSPKLVKTQAQNIFNGLVEIYPEQANNFKTNLDAFNEELDSLHSEIKNKLSGLSNRRFVTFHPSWGYFADEFGLEQIAIEVEGKEPAPGELSGIIKYLKNENLKVIFVQPQFSVKAAETIAKEIGGRIERIDPLPENYYESLTSASNKIYEALK